MPLRSGRVEITTHHFAIGKLLPPGGVLIRLHKHYARNPDSIQLPGNLLGNRVRDFTEDAKKSVIVSMVPLWLYLENFEKRFWESLASYHRLTKKGTDQETKTAELKFYNASDASECIQDSRWPQNLQKPQDYQPQAPPWILYTDPLWKTFEELQDYQLQSPPWILYTDPLWKTFRETCQKGSSCIHWDSQVSHVGRGTLIQRVSPSKNDLEQNLQRHTEELQRGSTAQTWEQKSEKVPSSEQL